MGGAILFVVAWIGATCGPMAVAVGFWRASERVRRGWPFHVLFLPCALATAGASVWLMFYAADDNGDGPPGSGVALIPAVLLLLLAIAGYFGALAITTIATLRRRT